MLPGRERLARLLAAAGRPERSAPAVLVGGTNGKGRLVAALSAVLSTRYRTGAFLKPHLKSVRERWRVNDGDASMGAFTAAAEETLGLIAAHGEPVSFFEANVLLGALLFQQARCEVAVWEVGLGGRHDACNLTDPFLSVLTGVGYDHQAVLGATLEGIARDKAHIARWGRPLLLASPRPGWEEAYALYAPVVAEVCRALGATLQALPPSAAAQWEAHLAAPWAPPPDTLALLDAALPQLAAAGFPLSAENVRAGLSRLRYRCRMERTVLAGQPVLLDAAHNVDALRWLALALGRNPFRGATRDRRTASTSAAGSAARYPVAFACQTSRDPRELLTELAPIAASLTPFEVPVLHPCPAGRIAEAAHALGIPLSLPPGHEPGSAVTDYAIGSTTELDAPDNRTGWIECVQHALGLGTAARPTVVCGSIYALGEVLRALEP